jgi:hypothetical protein
MQAYWKSLRWFSKDFFDKILFLMQKWTSNFGQSWMLVIIIIFISAFFATL